MLSVVKSLTFPPSRLSPTPTTESNIRHFVPQAGQVLLVTDSPASSAQFLVQALLQSQLKREGESFGNARGCIIVSVDHDFAHISAIAARSNLNLSQFIRERTLVYVDALSQASQPPGNLGDGGGAPEGPPSTPGVVICPPLATSLRPLYDVIRHAFELLSPNIVGKLLILGDVSTLEWIGTPATEVSRFVRAVRALAVKNECGVTVFYHSPLRDLPIESDVLRELVTSCDVHAEVRELSSGLSSAVSGEVALYPGFTAPDPHFVAIPRERALQYRLTDAGVIWFDRGTSAGVL
ncbi:unnamed protein product [Rhizoctonia solani]|uniref:Elongator complex protein 6 n=1 Tax=Rhizoctonia solani TaxID=456999 RepID=A0A8H3CH22_9AGAM|nr:unnamed protein product [Rhizoctonia solani]